MCVVVQIANSNPLVSDRQDLSVLQSEYAEDDTVYQLKIKVSQSAAPLRLLQPHVNPKFLCLNSQKLFWIWCYRFFKIIVNTGPAQKILVHSQDATRWKLFLQSLWLCTSRVPAR